MKQTIIETATNRLYRFFVDIRGEQSPDQFKLKSKDCINDLQVILSGQERLIGEDEITTLYPFKPEYVRNKRYQGRGPSYFKFGNSHNSRVFYRIKDIEQWIEEQKQINPFVAKNLM